MVKMKEKKTTLRVKIPVRDKVRKAAKKEERTIEKFVERSLIASADAALK